MRSPFRHKRHPGKAMTSLSVSQGTPGAGGGKTSFPPTAGNKGPCVWAKTVNGGRRFRSDGLCCPGLIARFRSGRGSSCLVVETYTSGMPLGTLATYNESNTIGPSSRGASPGAQAPGTRLQKVLVQANILWRLSSRSVTSTSITDLVTSPLAVTILAKPTTGTLCPRPMLKGPRSTLRSLWNMVILLHPVSWTNSNSANHAILGRRTANVT